MATVYSDDFNRADSTSIGADYTEVALDAQIKDNKLKNVTAGTIGSLVVVATGASASPSSADYDISAKVQAFTADSGNNISSIGVMGRYTDTTHFYLLRINFNGDVVQLYKFNGGATLLDDYAGSFAMNTEYTVKLTMVGSTIKGYIDGVERVSATDGDLTSTGDAGLRVYLDNSGGAGNVVANYISWDDFLIEQAGGVSAPRYYRSLIGVGV